MKNLAERNNFSIIIPTFQEVSNIPALIKRIASVDFQNRQFEVLIVDDNSQDGTTKIVQELQASYPWLNLIVRQAQKSLSLSVIDGFECAKYPLLITMDADLSHPPEKIPEMLDVLSDATVDFVIGSRYINNAKVDEVWPLSRKIVSRVAAQLARILLTANVKDPLSGFFAIKKSKYVSSDRLNPIGWKIGLEIMIKSQCKTIREIPIEFSERHSGLSKLNGKIALLYLRHLKRLAFYKIMRKSK